MVSKFKISALSATLAIQIADQLGNAIIEEKLAPGERIREMEFAARFNVSRATVRDALRILEVRGLVRILPQRGAQVTLLSSHELENLFEIRAVLLALASGRAAKVINPEDESILKRGLSDLYLSLNEPNEYARCSARMVISIAELSRNSQLTEMITYFAHRVGRYARLGLISDQRRRSSIANWEKLVAAIISKDEELAELIHRRLATENGQAAMLEVKLRNPVARQTG